VILPPWQVAGRGQCRNYEFEHCTKGNGTWLRKYVKLGLRVKSCILIRGICLRYDISLIKAGTTVLLNTERRGTEYESLIFARWYLLCQILVSQ
jgi:hypothetical protein